jgi:aspartyl/asparaginyl beta-hydroxylase (cupin superfamily)
MFFKPFEKINSQLLIDNFEIIKNEYLSIKPEEFYDYTSVKSGIENLLKNPQNTGEFWQIYPLVYKFEPWQGKKLKTIELLNKLGVTPLMATFSKLGPNSEIPPHQDHDETKVGPKNATTVIKYHLALDTPSNGECAIGVQDEKRIIKEGDLNIFDESMTHYVYNRSESHRGVLIISFLRRDIE